MTALWIILGIIIFFAVILALRVRLEVDFDSTAEENALRLRAGLGFIMITLIPKKEKKTKKPRLSSFSYKKHQKRLERERKKKEKEDLKKKAKEAAKEAEKKANDENVPFTEKIKSVFKIASFALSELPKLISYIHTKIRYLHISVGSPDAAETAKLYGGISIAATSFIALLEENTRYREPDAGTTGIEVDFLSEETKGKVGFSMSISLFSIVKVGLESLVWFIKFKSKKAN